LHFCLGGLGIGLLFSVGIYATEPRYTWDGNKLSLTSGNMDNLEIKSWQYWLYKKNHPQTNGNRWGILDNKSLVKLKLELKAEQIIEKQYSHWCNCDTGELTNFNFIGPVAIISRDLTQNSKIKACYEILEKQKKIIKKYMDVYVDYEKKNESLYARTNPLIHEQNGLEEYTKNLKEVGDRVSMLGDYLDKVSNIVMNNFDSSFSNSIQQLEKSTQKLTFAEYSLHANEPKASKIWTYSQCCEDSCTVVESVQIRNGKLFATNSFSKIDRRNSNQLVNTEISVRDVSLSDVVIDDHIIKEPTNNENHSDTFKVLIKSKEDESGKIQELIHLMKQFINYEIPTMDPNREYIIDSFNDHCYVYFNRQSDAIDFIKHIKNNISTSQEGPKKDFLVPLVIRRYN